MVYGYVNGFYQAHCATEGIAQEDCSLTNRIYQDFINANFIWVLASFMCYMVSNFARAFQWSILLEPISHKPKFYNSFWGVMVGYFANLGLPRMGEFVRAGMMSRYENIPFEKVMATVVNSRILDLIFLVITTIIASILEYDKLNEFFQYVGTEYGHSSIYILAIAALIMIGALVLIIKAPLSQIAIVRKIQEVAASFKDGLVSITQVKHPWQLLGHTATIWVMYVMMTFVGFWAYDPTSGVAFSAGMVVFVIGALGFVIPSSGGLGTYHAMMIIGLSLYGISEVDAFSYAMILFITLQIAANILFGVLSLILLPRLNAVHNPSK